MSDVNCLYYTLKKFIYRNIVLHILAINNSVDQE